jgi:tRNA(Ile2) C34 agmatinyltransferase TiaS
MARKPKKAVEKPLVIPENPIESQTIIDPSAIVDRMLHRSRPSCPECDAFPVVCTMKRPGCTAYRCRTCGHRWQEGQR